MSNAHNNIYSDALGFELGWLYPGEAFL
jgi:hypothetical protein